MRFGGLAVKMGVVNEHRTNLFWGKIINLEVSETGTYFN